MSEAYQRFTELEVWKQARQFKLEIYKVAKLFPSEEKYKLTDQITRSVRSIPTNISEGHGRFTYREQLNFCIIARGSLAETYNHLIDALDCQYISKETFQESKKSFNSVERLLNGYITFLRSQMNKK